MEVDRVIKSSEIAPLLCPHVGVAVHSNRTHIGILYRLADGMSVEVLHLAWNRALRSDTPSRKYVCWIRPDIHPDRAMAIAALCRRVWKQNQRRQITYAFSRPSGFFNEFGDQIHGPSKAGLTCASFVLAVFDAAGLPLIVERDWPPPDDSDMERQRELLQLMLEDPTATDEDVEAFRREMGSVRFRPLQVAGASTAAAFPTTYDFACQAATQIESLLEAM